MALTGLFDRLPALELLSRRGVLTGAAEVWLGVDDVRAEVDDGGAAVDVAVEVDVDVEVDVPAVVAGFSWLAKKGCRRIPELA
jgi:hypothetical protein